MKFSSIEDTVVVITGASSGICKGVALALARKGTKLVLAARRDNLLQELKAVTETHGGYQEEVEFWDNSISWNCRGNIEDKTVVFYYVAA